MHVRQVAAEGRGLYHLPTLEALVIPGVPLSRVYIDVKRDYEDSKVCSALCCGTPMKYALKEGPIKKVNYAWLCEYVVLHISQKFRNDNDTKLCNIFGLALLYACMSDSPDIEVTEHIRVRVKIAYNGLTLEETVPVMKVPLLVHQLGDQLQSHEQQLKNLQLGHQVSHSKLKNFIDSKIRVID